MTDINTTPPPAPEVEAIRERDAAPPKVIDDIGDQAMWVLARLVVAHRDMIERATHTDALLGEAVSYIASLMHEDMVLEEIMPQASKGVRALIEIERKRQEQQT